MYDVDENGVIKHDDGICKFYEDPLHYRIVYVDVIWSGDSLPVCSVCRMSPYESDFDKYHGKIIK